LIHEILPLLSEKEKEDIFQENDWELTVEIILRVFIKPSKISPCLGNFSYNT